MIDAQKITPNLWFNHNAREAVEFYVSVFPGSKIKGGSTYPRTADEGLADFQLDLAGQDLTIDFNVAGHDMVAINAGPEFRPTPANSFMVNFDPAHDDQAREHIDQVWEKLSDGGEVLLELTEYPFSKYYGWIQDKYGYSWQLILTNPEGEERPCIIPTLLFSGDVQNKAAEVIEYYCSVFQNSKRGMMSSYTKQTGPAPAGTLAFGDFMIENEWFAAMDSGVEQNYTFNEAVSYSVVCQDQAEIDALWGKLSAYPENEQCGWCKDKYGVSWQIVPVNMAELMQKPDAYAKMMQMKKLVIDDF